VAVFVGDATRTSGLAVFPVQIEAKGVKGANVVCHWTVDDVAAFFTSLKLDDCTPAIFENEIDGRLLLDLLAEDGLADLGITTKVQKAKIKRGLGKAANSLAQAAETVTPSDRRFMPRSHLAMRM
jgi:hypothetical protein